MNIDKIDLEIIMTMLFLEEDVTTTHLAKVIYDPNDRKELQDKDANLRKRMNKLVKYGILEKKKNKYWYYQLVRGSVLIGFKTSNGQIVMFQLPE